MNPIFQQAMYYGAVMLISIFIVAMAMRGFFWKYIKVKMSFGKYFLVKVRKALHDPFAVGWEEEGMICYKNEKKEVKRLAIPNGQKFSYRSIGVNWVDVDEEKNAIALVDYSAVTGFDAIKHEGLLTRALMRPSISSGKDKLLVILLLVAIVGSLAAAFYGFKSFQMASQAVSLCAQHSQAIVSSTGI